MINRKLLVLTTLLFSLWVFAQVGQKEKPETSSRSSSAASTDDSAELQALQGDVQRMRSLILQMQNNMAFVGTTTAPLYHQFELEISMWQLQLNEMDRRIQALQKSAK